jgi:hypothetical protein
MVRDHEDSYTPRDPGDSYMVRDHEDRHTAESWVIVTWYGIMKIGTPRNPGDSYMVRDHEDRHAAGSWR